MTLTLQQLGKSELYITPLGVGTAAMGSTPEWNVYWGPQDEADSIRAIHAALDLGINWIDTAAFYGWGRSEQVVGKALRGQRERAYVFTKCGTVSNRRGFWKEDLSPDNIRREVECSLRNLQTDYIDLYQFHDIDDKTPIEESWGTMQELIREGKVRYGGLSNHAPELIARAMRVGRVISNQLQYSVLRPEIERDLLPLSQQLRIGVLAWSPLASGFLTDEFILDDLHSDDFRRRLPFATGRAARRTQRVRETLRRIAVARHTKMSVVALAWVLRHPALTGAINGIRSEQEAQDMLRAIEFHFTEPELRAIKRAQSILEA